MKSKIQFIAAFSAAVLLFACNGETPSTGETKLSGSVSIDGSSTVYPITEAVATEFMVVNPDVKVTVGESGTGGGFKKFGRGEIDINDASRPIKSSEDSAAKAEGISYIELKVAFDGLTIVVNPKNTWCRDITTDELKKLWEPAAQGVITKWNQIRPEWPAEEIHLFGAGTQSGTFDYFTEEIMGKKGDCRGDYTASEDDNVLVQGVAGDKNALGFFGIGYFEANKDKLKAVSVNGVMPSIETVKNKSYTPLGRPLFIYINSKAGARKEVQEFARFYLANGATLSQAVGFVPMTAEETTAEQAKLEEFIKTHAAAAPH
ncbi:MAG: PstS family phosphate ABC transporter substrate-binding protein [Flavobacteriales bacterium]|nr:PstS family phosphate ABC transporter substrate-binding protein [Flavobacteriales bacterium]